MFLSTTYESSYVEGLEQIGNLDDVGARREALRRFRPPFTLRSFVCSRTGAALFGLFLLQWFLTLSSFLLRGPWASCRGIAKVLDLWTGTQALAACLWVLSTAGAVAVVWLAKCRTEEELPRLFRAAPKWSNILRIGGVLFVLSVLPWFSGCLFVFRSRRGTSIRILVYDGQGFWQAQKRLSKGKFVWWPSGNEFARRLEAHQAQLLLAAGNPETTAAPSNGPLKTGKLHKVFRRPRRPAKMPRADFAPAFSPRISRPPRSHRRRLRVSEEQAALPPR